MSAVDEKTPRNSSSLHNIKDNRSDSESITVNEVPEDDSQYPTGLPMAMLTLGLCLVVFTVALDNTIIGENA